MTALAALAPATEKADACAPLTAKQISRNRELATDAPRYATYAILSSNVYARETPIPLPPG